PRGGATVAYLNTIVGKNIWGADCVTITPGVAQQYNLPANSGVLVNDVEKNSFAETIGLQEGDIIQEINNQPIYEIGNMLLVLADKNVGDKMKIKVIRNKRNSKNLKFAITDVGMMTSVKADKLGIMSTGQDLSSPVAYSLVNALYLIVYDTTNDNFYAVKNPYRGAANYEVSNWIISQKVGNVIVGNISQSDLLNLQQAEVKVFGGVFGHASDAVKLYHRGNLIAKAGGIDKVALVTNKINVLAIPVNYPDLSANISGRAESARYFIKVELDHNKSEIIANPEFGQLDGAMVAQFLVDNEVDAVIANQVGSDTIIELKKLNVAVYPNVDLNAGDAVQRFLNNKLNPL
ncbi:MAG: PDZ domain-containing protein, partial [Oligoflexia bacterium]|nr:PDZ domain-containing protein [Oligoflexia bacterium]